MGGSERQWIYPSCFQEEKEVCQKRVQKQGIDLKMNLRFIKSASASEKLKRVELDKIKKEDRDAFQAELAVLEQKMSEVYNKLLGPKFKF